MVTITDQLCCCYASDSKQGACLEGGVVCRFCGPQLAQLYSSAKTFWPIRFKSGRNCVRHCPKKRKSGTLVKLWLPLLLSNVVCFVTVTVFFFLFFFLVFFFFIIFFYFFKFWTVARCSPVAVQLSELTARPRSAAPFSPSRSVTLTYRWFCHAHVWPVGSPHVHPTATMSEYFSLSDCEVIGFDLDHTLCRYHLKETSRVSAYVCVDVCAQ